MWSVSFVSKSAGDNMGWTFPNQTKPVPNPTNKKLGKLKFVQLRHNKTNAVLFDFMQRVVYTRLRNINSAFINQ